jgi:hypothetical protein
MYKAACVCQAKGPRPTLVDLGNGVQVGLVGMEAAFERFHAEGREPLPALGEELLVAIREHNYVSRTQKVEEEYKAALLREYGTYCAVRS